MTLDYDIGDGADALATNQLTDALEGTYWVSGWSATAGSGDYEVDIASGEGVLDGASISTGATQTVDFSADVDSSEPRKAVVYVDGNGVQKAVGNTAPAAPSDETRFRTYQPSPPAAVAGVVVAEVWLGAGASSVGSDDIRDRRVSNQASANNTPNTPNWVEDGNSPHTFSDVSETTYLLEGEYDEIQLRMKVSGDSGRELEIRLNGDSASNYSYYRVDGNSSTSTSQIPLTDIAQDETTTTVEIAGRWDGFCGLQNNARQFANNVALSGENESITSPLTEFTLADFSGTMNITGTVEVYGRDID